MLDSRRCVHALTAFVLLLIISNASNAQNTIHIPGDQPSIQQAIFAANNGDTIVVAPGNYFEQINFFGKAVTLASSDGPSATVLNGFNSFTVVNLFNGEGNGSVLRGFTINGSNGTGIMVSGSSPVIENNIITNGTGCSGGVGITLNFSGAIVRNNVITANQDFCGAAGAGILVQGSNVNSVQLLNNTITFNQTSGNGAGIALLDAGTPVVSANTIRNNTASQGLGGGIYMTGNTTPVLSDNLIAGNQASVGGGVYSLVGNATIINNTVVNNSIVGQPSGDAPQVFVDGADSAVQFFNNIFIDRTGKGAVFCGSSNFSVPSFTNNDVLSTDPGQPGQPPVLGYTGSCQDATGTNGNIQQDPLFIAEILGLPDNGDYHLQAASPAVDTGFSDAPNLPQLDLDGNPRIAAGSEISCNPVVDMGAYELLAVTTGMAVLSPTSLNFGSGQIGLPPNTQTLFLQATQGCVQVHSIKTTGDYQTSSNCSAMFAGGSCSIQVAFTPKTAGIRAGTVTVDIGPAAPSQSATLVGEGVNSGSVSPTSLSFGTWPIQSGSSFQSIQVQTANGVVMQVNSVSITGDFVQFNSCSSQFGQLPTGIACFVDVQFVPTAGGPRTGTLTINTSQGVFTVPLSGNGAAPVPVLTPATVAFASQVVGSTSSAQTVTLSNNGTADLFINGFNASADFQVAPLSCAGFLPSGANCTLAVTFTPTTIGLRAGVLEVDTNGGPATAALSGTATPPIATLAPQILGFAPQSLLTTGDAQTVTVTNISGAPLNLISISAVDNFFATSNCPATLALNGSCTISVAYAPQSLTPDSGVLTVRTNLGAVTALLSVTHRTINVPSIDAFSINQAVSIAQDGDTVLVAPGTYFEQVNFLGKAITVASAGGPRATVIDPDSKRQSSPSTLKDLAQSCAALPSLMATTAVLSFPTRRPQLKATSSQVTTGAMVAVFRLSPVPR
jgi:parallel beta-helix repeat protein